MDLGPVTIANQAQIPANSQITPLLDTTYWNDAAPWPSAAATPAPGRSRSQLAGARVEGSITPTGQAVTVTFEALIDPSGTTNAAWATDANGPDSGTKVVAAGATYPFDWLPRLPDYRITITSGATKPTAMTSTLILVWDRNAGV